MFQPEDITNKDFKKAFRGFDQMEVLLFLDELRDEYEEILKENDALKEKVALFEGQISKYTNIETTLKETLITAQTAAEDTTSAANRKAKIIVQEAELNARQIIENANNEVVRIRTEYNELIKEFKIFRNKFLSLLEDEARNVDEIFSGVEDNNAFKFAGEIDGSTFPNPETIKIREFEKSIDQEDVVSDYKQDANDIEVSDVDMNEETTVMDMNILKHNSENEDDIEIAKPSDVSDYVKEIGTAITEDESQNVTSEKMIDYERETKVSAKEDDLKRDSKISKPDEVIDDIKQKDTSTDDKSKGKLNINDNGEFINE